MGLSRVLLTFDCPWRIIFDALLEETAERAEFVSRKIGDRRLRRLEIRSDIFCDGHSSGYQLLR